MKKFACGLSGLLLGLAAHAWPAGTPQPQGPWVLPPASAEVRAEAAEAKARLAATTTIKCLVGHRGDSESAPENTMPAFLSAQKKGFNIETDVYMTRDGVVFLTHDQRINRKDSGLPPGIWATNTVWKGQLEHADAGAWMGGKWKGTKYPRLGELLALARDGQFIILEIKDPRKDLILPAIGKEIEKFPNVNPGNVYFQGAGPGLRKILPGYRDISCSLAREKPAIASKPLDLMARARKMDPGRYAVWSLRWDEELVTRELVDVLHARGIKVGVWTVNDAPSAWAALGRGVDWICTDRPAALAREMGLSGAPAAVRNVPAPKGVRAAWVLDAGRSVRATGLRFRADASRRYCRTPGAARVYAVETPDGSGPRRELASDDRLPPAFAGESSFLRWSAATSRYWLVEAPKGGTDALRAFGQYFDWVFPRTKTRWGIPCNGDAGTGNDCAPAAIELFDAEPDDFPRANAPSRAFPEHRLVKDWLMQDFGVEGAVTNRPPDLQAYLAKCRTRRVERLRRVAAECPRIVYVKHYTMGGDAELHGTALVTDEQVTGRPANFRKGGQLCLLTVRPDGTVTNEVLVSRPEGCIRDPDVSFDGRLVVFSMRSSFNENAYVRRLPKAGPGGPTRDRGFPYDFYTKLEGDDYHLYTFDLETRELKQLTFSDPAPCADIEPCWTSGGEIVFQSSRCEQTIPCHQTQDVNLYVCRADGTHVRRLAIDGGCTSHPRELPDGRILYTRYEYNDRSARLQQPLFTMNPDGTQQQAYYGNASAFPASLMHFRPIPGSDEVIGILSGHHVHQQGKLVRLDRRKGTDGDAGLVFVAGSDILERGAVVPSDYAKDPRMVEAWHPDSIDFITQTGAQWQNPYPLSAGEWICGFLPEGALTIKNPSRPGFGIYWQNERGERELLAWDASIECSQAVPARPRAKAFVRALPERNREDPFGTFHVQDVYTGPGLAGIARGTVKTLRVVAVENRPVYTYSCAMPAPVEGRYRPFLAYGGDHSGEAVTAGGAWDVKHVLGEVDVANDGSCTFRCPANNPVYFQLLDERGRCVQTMRSWTHLRPGEAASCVGCHEDKAQAYPPRAGQAAMRIQKLRPARGQSAHPLLARLEREGLYASAANFLGVNGPVDVRPDAPTAGFSFPRLVQPVLDRNCVKCHDGSERNAKRPNLTGAWRKDFRPEAHRAFSHAYAALTKEGRQTAFCNWYSCMGRAEMLPPYAQGSATSLLMAYFDPVHHGVTATEDEKRVVQCWIDLAIPFAGSYCEATVWSDDDRRVYDYHQRKRVAFAQREIAEQKRNMVE